MRSEANATSAVPAAPNDGHGFEVSERYRRYVIWLLFVIYALNFVDRQILTILIQPIKQEFGLSDTQLGLLGGIAFAALYSTLGIPIARVADKRNRVNIITAALLVWSSFTALTGFARSFTHLLLARVAVGIGEAGCSPTAYSLIGDYFEPKRRSTAISIYSMGIYGGVLVGFLVGGHVAQAYGWRAAFYVVGLPGVVLAAIVKLTLREPPRGFADTARVDAAPASTRQTIAKIWAFASFRHLSLAAALHSFVGYGIGSFTSAFLMRSHGLTLAEVGNWLAAITALGGITGTYLGGFLADRCANQTGDRRWQLWVPALSTLLNVPISLLVYSLDARYAVLALMIPATAIGAMYLGPTFAVVQDLAAPRERAVAGALLLCVINLIGLGLGPLLTGALSDMFAAQYLARGTDELQATAQGLRWALYVMTCVNVWSAFHYWRAGRTLRADLCPAPMFTPQLTAAQ